MKIFFLASDHLPDERNPLWLWSARSPFREIVAIAPVRYNCLLLLGGRVELLSSLSGNPSFHVKACSSSSSYSLPFSQFAMGRKKFTYFLVSVQFDLATSLQMTDKLFTCFFLLLSLAKKCHKASWRSRFGALFYFYSRKRRARCRSGRLHMHLATAVLAWVVNLINSTPGIWTRINRVV